MKKKILIFGDSNTWGCKPMLDLAAPHERWDDEERWPGVLQGQLGSEYEVIQDGLNGRTTVFDSPLEPQRCGKDQLLSTLVINGPLDLAIIALGCNDVKVLFSASPQDIAIGAGLLCDIALNTPNSFKNKTPKVLLMCPQVLGPVDKTVFHEMFGISALEKSKKLHQYYEVEAKNRGIGYFNADTVVKSSEIDGLHLDVDQHEILGKEMAKVIKQMGL